MTQPVTLIHTADVHRGTFDDLRDRIAPNARLVHHVRTDWLDRARKNGVHQDLIGEMAQLIHAAPGAVLCTCTTLGEAASALGALRIDGPMMARAAEIGGPILMVYALESTYAPSLALLGNALEAIEKPAKVLPLSIAQFWPLFEAGETTAFTACVAGAVRDALTDHEVACVVLAQASMAAAADMLTDIGVPVLVSPESALRAALEI
jgi:hypothetical protein